MQPAFTNEQHKVLLKGINASRIETRKAAGMTLSYLSQHDVRAHLIRIFGYGNFDLTTEQVDLAFESERSDGKWDVGYRVTMRLAIRSGGQTICEYSETAVGTSTQGRRGEAHDMAMKTASSDAMKRCAINLGDQFGLSLYENGSTAPIVRATLITSPDEDAPASPEKAPQSDEQPDEAPAGTPKGGTASEEVLEAQQFLSGLTDMPSRERITAVAKFKAGNTLLLQSLINIDGQDITIARYADLIAAGRYAKEEDQ